MKIYSYSKINYTLEVGSKREDGFHSLESIVQTLSLKDSMEIEISNDKTELTCNDPSVPTDGKNTICKACNIFFEYTKIDKGLKIHLNKNIPSQAGMGGGSGNGSAILLALNEIFQTDLSTHQLADLSAKIGSDCPLFIYGGTVFMTGRGEIIEELNPFPKAYFLIAKPDFSVSTKEAYQKLDLRKNTDFSGISQSLAKSKNVTFDILKKSLINNFEILCANEINPIKTDFLNNGADACLLCGSGSCVFGMFESKSMRDTAFENLKEQYNLFTAQSENKPIIFAD